jgi:hypothetical protein
MDIKKKIKELGGVDKMKRKTDLKIRKKIIEEYYVPQEVVDLIDNFGFGIFNNNIGFKPINKIPLDYGEKICDIGIIYGWSTKDEVDGVQWNLTKLQDEGLHGYLPVCEGSGRDIICMHIEKGTIHYWLESKGKLYLAARSFNALIEGCQIIQGDVEFYDIDEEDDDDDQALTDEPNDILTNLPIDIKKKIKALGGVDKLKRKTDQKLRKKIIKEENVPEEVVNLIDNFGFGMFNNNVGFKPVGKIPILGKEKFCEAGLILGWNNGNEGIQSYLSAFKNEDVEGYLPIVEGYPGDVICLHKEKGTVHYWSHENGKFYLAARSFNAFIQGFDIIEGDD